MKKVAWVSLAVIALVLLLAPPSDAQHWHRGGTRVFVGVGPGWWGWGSPWWGWGSPWWGYPPYAWAPPTVVVQQPPTWVEQPALAPPAPPAPGPQSFWYYCPGAQGFYPNVQNCAEPWVKVPPRTE